MPKFISHQPLGGFDLTAIGIVLVVVMAVIGTRWLARILSGKSKYDFGPETETDYRTKFEDLP